jgi:hypothetical protein
MPNVLAHIPSFQAALQIISPLDDNSWEMLRSRLLSQRADAEEREKRYRLPTAPSTTAEITTKECHVHEWKNRESKELLDKDWDNAQASLRAEISMYADEFILDSWDDGNKVNKESSSSFAVDVLLHVRKRFYIHVAKEAAAARAAGKEPIQDPPQGPFTQKLTLENMKWLFEVKIKPHTEPCRKELFLCNGCDDSLKAYGFEGVVQHYAAKHTTAMSVGSIVVYWRSEWPEVPPFHPDPVAKSIESQSSRSATMRQSVGHAPLYNYIHHPISIYGGLIPAHFDTTYHGQYAHPDGQFQKNTYGPAMLHPPPPPPPPPHSPPPPTYPHQPTANQLVYSVSHGIARTPAALQAMPHFSQHFGGGFPGPPIVNSYTSDVQETSGATGHALTPAVSSLDRMRAQLQELARISREMWIATAGVKELPGYIRVYVFFFHLAHKYRSRFFESPPLVMFIDGLSNRKEMRPVRNVNGLICKACHLRLDNLVPVENERTTFSLPQLVNHFEQKHLEQSRRIGAPLLDWTVDMVFLPEVATLSILRTMAGVDSNKYKLITEAFPQMFSTGPVDVQEQGVPHTNTNSYPGHEQNCAHQVPYSVETPAAAQLSIQMSSDDIQGRTQGQYVPTLATYSEVHPDQPYLNATIDQQLHMKSATIRDEHTLTMGTSPKSNYNNSGRNSPERPIGKHRQRRLAGKGKKSRKGITPRSISDSSKSVAEPVESEEDNAAEVETQREEEAIRAMWAADRKATARLASNSTAPLGAQTKISGDDSAGAIPEARHGTIGSPVVPVVGASAPQLRRHDPPIGVLAGEEDLFASLELQLDQQRALRLPRRSTSERPQTEDPVQATGQNVPVPSRALLSMSQTCAQDRDRSCPPNGQANRRVASHQDLYNRDLSMVSHSNLVFPYAGRVSQGAVESLLGRGRATTRHFANHYEQSSLQREYQAYADELRPRRTCELSHAKGHPSDPMHRAGVPQVSYTGIYERVLVRDSRGNEYYVERHLRGEPEIIPAPYEDELPRYRDHSVYQNRERSDYWRDSLHESFRADEDSFGGQATHETHLLRSENHLGQIKRDDAPRAVEGSCEEYDPRFPAAPSRLQRQ